MPRGFSIPVSKDQSTTGARQAYSQLYQLEWPHDDVYLRELAIETKQKVKTGKKTSFLLELMRESH